MKILHTQVKEVAVLLAIVLLSYVVSLIAPVLSYDFPQLRFYGKYVFVAALLSIALLLLLNGRKVRLVPGTTLFCLFVAYFLLHSMIFEQSASLFGETFGQSVILLYLLYAAFYVILRDQSDYLNALRSIWFFLIIALGYYLVLLYQSRGGILFSSVRIGSEDVGQTLNSNVLCFQAVIFSIVSLRLYEIDLSSSRQKFKKTDWIWPSLVFLIVLFSLLFSFLHASFTSIFLMCIVLVVALKVMPLRFKTKIGLFCIIITISFLGINVFDEIGMFDQLSLIDERIKEGGSTSERSNSLLYVWSQFEKHPFFGNSADPAVYDGTGSTNHTFYMNILSIYGVFGFILYIFLFTAILLPGLSSVSSAQLLAGVFLLIVWAVAPTNYFQVIALLVLIPDNRFNNSRLSQIRI